MSSVRFAIYLHPATVATSRPLDQILGGEFSQFVVNQRQELLGGVGIALFNGTEDVGDFAHPTFPRWVCLLEPRPQPRRSTLSPRKRDCNDFPDLTASRFSLSLLPLAATLHPAYQLHQKDLTPCIDLPACSCWG
jgi:hypothetical protein